MMTHLGTVPVRNEKRFLEFEMKVIKMVLGTFEQ